MSDKRATIAISTSIVAAALIIGIATAIPATNNFSVASTALPIMGHVTVTITDADGNLKSYIQADNVSTHVIGDCIANDIFGAGITPAIPDPACGAMVLLGIGFNGTPELDTDTTLLTETASLRTACALTGTPAVPAAAGAGTIVTCTAAVHTITVADIALGIAIDAGPLITDGPAGGTTVECADLSPIGGPNDSCEIREVGLFDIQGAAPAADMYGRVTIPTLTGIPSSANFVKVGDTVAATYTTTIG